MTPINRIEIEGYKSFQEVGVGFGRLNVLLGANGAGKSNFISLFSLMREIISGRLQNYVRRSGGANRILHNGRVATDRITIKLAFGRNGYRCILTPDEENSLFIESETVIFRGDYVANSERVVTKNKDESALKEAASHSEVAKYCIDAMTSWGVYHFHDTSSDSPLKQPSMVSDSIQLSTDGSNLPSILLKLKTNNPDLYLQIVSAIKLVAPYFDDFILESEKEVVSLRWKRIDGDYVLGVNQISDGTIRFMAICTLLYQPNPPSTIVIDEPELGLHPYAINILSDLLKSVSQRTQVIVSTQSVGLVDNMRPEDIIVFDHLNGKNIISRPDVDILKIWLDDYSLGEVWQKNILGGRPR